MQREERSPSSEDSPFDRYLTTDTQGNIEDVHPSFAQQMKQQVDELVGHSLAEFVTAVEKDILREILNRYDQPPQAEETRTAQSLSVEVDVEGPESLRLVAQLIVNDQDEPIGFAWHPSNEDADEEALRAVQQLEQAPQSGHVFETKPAPHPSLAEPSIDSRFEKTELLYRLSHALLLSQSLPEVLQSTVDHLGILLKECKLLLMCRPSALESIIRVIERRGDRAFPDRLLLDSAIRASLTENWSGEQESERVFRQKSPGPGASESWTGTTLMLPILHQNNTIGTVLALHPDPDYVFPVYDLSTLHEMLEQTAIAVGNVQIRREAEQRANEMSQYSEKLLRTNAELQRFIYTASHDFQEPLRMISNYVQLLAHRYGERLDEDADTFIRFAVEGVQHLQAMISDLLLYANLDGQAYKLAEVDSSEAVEQALLLLSDKVVETDARISIERLPVIQSDLFLMTQLMYQLLDNGLKFRSQDRPQIVVSAAREQGTWTFRIHDDGIGIDPEYHQKIFDVFQRLHSRSEYIGTGMGLAIARKIVEWHGGTIWVESQVGQGTTFCFTIPE